MSELRKVQNADVSPTKCIVCDDHAGPFIDTGVSTPVHGRVYICAANEKRPGCIRQMARLDGMLDPDVRGELFRAKAEIQILRAELEDVKRGKFVQVGDVVDYLQNTAAATTAPADGPWRSYLPDYD